VLVLRDQIIGGVPDDLPGQEGDGAAAPSLDLSLNYTPVMYPLYKPGVILVKPSRREFWRVVNASADTTFDLQLLYWPNADSQTVQSVKVVAVDGIPVGSEFRAQERKSLLLPPGARVEFIMTTPPAGLFAAQFLTRRYDNGPAGDRDSYRVIANLKVYSDAPDAPGKVPEAKAPERGFTGLTGLKPALERKLYFSEKTTDPAHRKTSTSYFLTAGGAEPKAFDMNAKTPNLIAEQGTIEDWVVENRANEAHVFHIHQLHFQLLERDGKPVSETALRDTIELPFWDGKSAYPSVKLRMNFRDASIIGMFLYHCHILEHEDRGMMGSIQVVAATTSGARKTEKTESKN
jgi:FtsP/CotA-like multicopper oxidase with cupredoxin domain